MRLNTYVAQQLGISGRRACDGIERGGVRINGELERFADDREDATHMHRIAARLRAWEHGGKDLKEIYGEQQSNG